MCVLGGSQRPTTQSSRFVVAPLFGGEGRPDGPWKDVWSAVLLVEVEERSNHLRILLKGRLASFFTIVIQQGVLNITL